MRITNNQLEKIIKLSTTSTENNTVNISYDNNYFYLNLEYDILSDKLEGDVIHIDGNAIRMSLEQWGVLSGFLNELVAEAEDREKAKELEVIDYYEYNGKN